MSSLTKSPTQSGVVDNGGFFSWTNTAGVIGNANGNAESLAPVNGDCFDHTVTLTFNGTDPVGSNKASAVQWPYSEDSASYGTGQNDKWGTTPVLGDVKGNANFGLMIAVVQENPAGDPSDYLLSYTFDFSSIPAASTINGFAASFDRFQSGGGLEAEVNNVQLTVYFSAVPANTVAPSVTGIAQVGQVLTSGTGTWTNSPSGYAYQWQRSNGGAYSDIVGATSSTYSPVVGDIGYTIKSSVLASNTDGPAASPALSAATSAVIAGTSAVSQFSVNGRPFDPSKVNGKTV